MYIHIINYNYIKLTVRGLKKEFIKKRHHAFCSFATISLYRWELLGEKVVKCLIRNQFQEIL